MHTLNGFEVVAWSKTPARGLNKAGAIVLVHRGAEYRDAWVTAWHGDGDEGWIWGHYFELEYEAREDFAARSNRGY